MFAVCILINEVGVEILERICGEVGFVNTLDVELWLGEFDKEFGVWLRMSVPLSPGVGGRVG